MYSGPVNGTPVAESALPATSLMPAVAVRFSPSVPPTDPVLTVTVRVAPVPAIDVIDVPGAVPTSVKLLAVTPVTGSENVTVKPTLAALMGVASTSVIAVTEGGVLSIVSEPATAVPQFPEASFARTQI